MSRLVAGHCMLLPLLCCWSLLVACHDLLLVTACCCRYFVAGHYLLLVPTCCCHYLLLLLSVAGHCILTTYFSGPAYCWVLRESLAHLLVRKCGLCHSLHNPTYSLRKIWATKTFGYLPLVFPQPLAHSTSFTAGGAEGRHAGWT